MKSKRLYKPLLLAACCITPLACPPAKEQPPVNQHEMRGYKDAPTRGSPCTLRISPITDGQVGVLAVGMSVDALLRLCPSANRVATTDVEGASQALYYVPITELDTIVAAIDSTHGREVIRSLSIEFLGPKDSRGIGVGNTLGQLRQRYPRLGTDDNEGRVYVWPMPDLGLSFALGIEAGSLDGRWRTNPGAIPDSTHVIELLVRKS